MDGRTTAKLARQLRESGIRVGTRTVAMLRSMGYSLRVNHKKLAANHPQRDAQFARITVLRRRGASENIPIISIDTKKKELIGRFKNAGAKWDRYPEQVHDHDFRSLASGVAVPYGLRPARQYRQPGTPATAPIASPHGGAITESSPIPTPAA